MVGCGRIQPWTTCDNREITTPTEKDGIHFINQLDVGLTGDQIVNPNIRLGASQTPCEATPLVRCHQVAGLSNLKQQILE